MFNYLYELNPYELPHNHVVYTATNNSYYSYGNGYHSSGNSSGNSYGDSSGNRSGDSSGNSSGNSSGDYILQPAYML